MVTSLNFQFSSRRTALASIQNLGRNSATSLPYKMQDVNDLMHHLIDVWAGVEQIVIDNATDQRLTSPSLPSSHKRTF